MNSIILKLLKITKYLVLVLILVLITSFFHPPLMGYLWTNLYLGKPGEIYRTPILLDKKGKLIDVYFDVPVECDYAFKIDLVHDADDLNYYRDFLEELSTNKYWASFDIKLLPGAEEVSEVIAKDSIKVNVEGLSMRATSSMVLMEYLTPNRYQIKIWQKNDRPKFKGIKAEFYITTIHRANCGN